MVVSDTTCLIGLERIGHLDLLKEMFGNVFVPPSVATEFGGKQPWLEERAPRNTAHVAALRFVLGAGEAEAIALATELGCEVILDDLKARGIAARQNGVLLRAKKAGKIIKIRPLIERLTSAGFFISESLAAEALLLAKE